MAEDGNAAVLEAPGTAPETMATPDPIEVETEAEASLETTETGSPEGEAQDGEATDSASEPKTYTQEDFDKALKDQEARLKESARQREENAKREADENARKESYERNLTASRTVRRDTFAVALRNEVARVVKLAVDEGKEYVLHPQTLAQLAGALEYATFIEEDKAHADAFDDYVAKSFPDWKPSREMARAVETAVHRGDPVGITEARFNLMRQAAIEAGRAEWEKEEGEKVRERAAGEAKVAQTQAAEKSRASQTARPTNVTGAAAGGAGIDHILETASPISPEYRRAYKQKHGFDPV